MLNGVASHFSSDRSGASNMSISNLGTVEVVKLTPSQKWAKSRREYDRSFAGLPRRRYRDMKSRIAGKPQYGDRWKGLELLPLEDFVQWSLNGVDSNYPALWEAWSKGDDFPEMKINGTIPILWSGRPYQTLLAPSIDRIDSTIGYVLGNMQWLTRSEHMKRSSAARINGRYRI